MTKNFLGRLKFIKNCANLFTNCTYPMVARSDAEDNPRPILESQLGLCLGPLHPNNNDY